MDHAVTVRNVHKPIGDFQSESIHLEIEKGTISTLIEDNGAGKNFEYDDEFNKAIRMVQLCGLF